jgi:hypothetical protein
VVPDRPLPDLLEPVPVLAESDPREPVLAGAGDCATAKPQTVQ